MADTPSVKIIKEFTYEGSIRPWSNRYHIHPGVPDTNEKWDALFDAIVEAESAIYDSGTTIIEAVAYLAGEAIPHHSKTYDTPGIGSGDGYPAPGDCAALARFETTKRSSRNHPVYCFSFWHGVEVDGSLDPQIRAWQQTAYEDYASAWVASGFGDGADVYKRCTPDGHTTVGSSVDTYARHRDFPR